MPRIGEFWVHRRPASHPERRPDTFFAVGSLSELMAAFAVVSSRPDGDENMRGNQLLTTAVADHRGRIEMPAYAMMAESITSGTFWYSFDEPVATVQSWLSLTAGIPVGVDQRLVATSELLHSDGQYGTTTLRVTSDDGVVCAGLARCVLVSRIGDSLAEIRHAPPVETAQPVPGAAAVVAPPLIDPGLDGSHVLSAISDGTVSSGPLCELLCATVFFSAGRLQMTVSPQPWMANPLSGVQGGVIATIMGQACSFAGQLHTGAGQQYSIADLTVYYFRSPPVDDGPLTVSTSTDRAGRRLGTVSAVMAGHDGSVFARATANIRYW